MKALQIPQSVRAALAERSGGLCEVRHECQVAEAVQAHHRRARGMGGSRRPDTNTLSNLLHVCLEDHAWIESHRADALGRGWLVRQSYDPADMPVFYSNQSILRVPCYLADDGSIRTATPAELIEASMAAAYGHPLTDEEMSTP